MTQTQPKPVAFQPIDRTDIPRADVADMALIIDILIAQGQALVLVNGADEETTEALERAFWANFVGSHTKGHAAWIRFQALMEVMQSKRLTSMFFQRGFAAIAPLLAAAAELRLNASWGFVPQRIVNALNSADKAVIQTTEVVAIEADDYVEEFAKAA